MGQSQNKEPNFDPTEENNPQFNPSTMRLDIVEELDVLIPDQLIEDNPPANLKIKSTRFIFSAYLFFLCFVSVSFIIPTSYSYSTFFVIPYFFLLPLFSGLWAYKVKRNNLALGAQKTTISPLWSALLLFVPIFNTLALLPIYQELWKTSVSPKNWEEVKNSRLVLSWGILRIIILAITVYSTTRPDGQNDPRDCKIILYFSVPLSIIGFLMEALIVIMTTKKQNSYISAQYMV